MAKKDYSSYEKIVESTVTRIRHIVRIRLNEGVADILSTMQMVPPGLTVSMIVDDTENVGYGEIVFIEEQEQERD